LYGIIWKGIFDFFLSMLGVLKKKSWVQEENPNLDYHNQ